DLLGRALERATRLIFLNPGVEVCIANARARPWEPHKYPSREAQDANLEMLVRWIRDYETRADVFSLRAHRALFDSFGGGKVEVTELASWRGAEGEDAGVGARRAGDLDADGQAAARLAARDRQRRQPEDVERPRVAEEPQLARAQLVGPRGQLGEAGREDRA